jgi:hypothetical protein
MTTLAAEAPRTYAVGDYDDYPMVAFDIIYQGAAVGENDSGYAQPLVATKPFLGFAEHTVDNSAGAAGAKSVRVLTRGVVRLTVAGATAITANDRPAVYALDDNSFTLTATSASLIGYVRRWLASTDCLVEFDALAVKAALHA